MGGCRGAFNEQQELLDGETRLGKDGVTPTRRGRLSSMMSRNTLRDGYCMLRRPSSATRAAAMRGAPPARMRTAALPLPRRSGSPGCPRRTAGDHVDAMTLIAHIVLDPGLLQPTHYHFRAGDIHHFHDTVEIKGRSQNQFSDNQKHTGRIPVVSLLLTGPVPILSHSRSALASKEPDDHPRKVSPAPQIPSDELLALQNPSASWMPSNGPSPAKRLSGKWRQGTARHRQALL